MMGEVLGAFGGARRSMDDDFDPYSKWLGVRDARRPPDHYALLGLEPQESDPDVIARAADQRMAHVRSFATGPRQALSQRILNELAAARVCLLEPQSKRRYDARLHEMVAPPVTSPATSHLAARSVDESPAVVDSEVESVSHAFRQRRRRSNRLLTVWLVMLVLVLGIGAVMLLLVQES